MGPKGRDGKGRERRRREKKQKEGKDRRSEAFLAGHLYPQRRDEILSVSDRRTNGFPSQEESLISPRYLPLSILPLSSLSIRSKTLYPSSNLFSFLQFFQLILHLTLVLVNVVGSPDFLRGIAAAPPLS